jgi:O-antigen ligase
MTPTPIQLLALQCAIAMATYVFLFRKTDLPFGLKIILIGTYITVPLALLVKGIQSAIYVSDLFLPIFLISALLSSRESRNSRHGLVTALLLLIVILPLMLAFLQGFIGDQRGGLGSRNVKGDIIWLYRNLTYVVLLGYGLSLRLTAGQVLSFFRMNIVFAGTLALMGLVSYFGPVNLAFFEDLAWREWVEEGYRENRIGLGFMGLFRASVGQWFAMIALIIAGTYAAMPQRYRFLAVWVMGASIGVILLSQSRAGLVGLGIGFLLLSLLAQGWVPKVMAVVGVSGTLAWILFRQDVLASRAASIFAGTQNAHDRVRAWERAYDFFSQHTDAFLFGVGPANRDAVFKVIGEYGAHNEYIDALFRLGFFGLVGLIGFLLVIVMTLLAARHRFGPEGHAILTTTAILVIANCVMGVTQEHLLHDYASHTMGVYIYLLYGVVLGTASPPQIEESVSEENQDPQLGSESGYAIASSQR